MQRLNIASFKIAAGLTLMLGISVLACSFIAGKQELFLFLNANLGKAADLLFRIATEAGNGLLWIAALALVLFFKRKDILPLLIGSFVFSTLLTQICKYLIVPNALRPIRAIADTALIHTVEGVELHEVSSFPSGHTATAFTFYLLVCLIFPQRVWVAAGMLYAVAVAYSRVYLAQHFPVDLGAGMIVAVISVTAALAVQKNISDRRSQI